MTLCASWDASGEGKHEAPPTHGGVAHMHMTSSCTQDEAYVEANIYMAMIVLDGGMLAPLQ